MEKNIKCYIYKITCNKTGKLYFGSTTETVSRRLTKHKNNFNRFLNGKSHYVTSFEIIKEGNYKIELVEELNCCKYDLHQRERFHIENNICINKNIPNRTNADSVKNWRKNNREKHDLYMREYMREYKRKQKIKKMMLKINKIDREMTAKVEAARDIMKTL